MQIAKNKKSLILCVLSGVLCMFFVFLYATSVKGEAEETRNAALSRYGGEQIEVCVAKRDIAAGEKIDSSCYELKLWLADLLPDDAIRNSNDIMGKQTTSSIICGEVITSKRFQESAVSLEVPSGMTAVSVPAKDVSAVGGAISSGMYVNVYATGNTSTSLIAENVLVLATSTTFKETTTSSVNWITLAVEPDLVQELVSASQTTSLYFSLPSEESENSIKNSDEDDSKTDSTNPENNQINQYYDKKNYLLED